MRRRDGVKRRTLNGDRDEAGEGLVLRFLVYWQREGTRFRGGVTRVMCCSHWREL